MSLLPFVALSAMCVPPSLDVATPISELRPTHASQGWGTLGYDRSVEGRPLRLGRRSFAFGLGTHATSEIAFNLRRRYKRFQSWVGLDAELEKYRDTPDWKKLGPPRVAFRVIADGREIFASGEMSLDSPPLLIDVPVDKVSTLKLIVEDGGNGIWADHADWAGAQLVGPTTASLRPHAGVPRFHVRTRGLTVDLDSQGTVCGLRFGRTSKAALGFTDPAGLPTLGVTSSKTLPGRGVEFLRRLPAGTMRERFSPTADSVRWTIEVTTQGKPWSEPIETTLVWPQNPKTRMWTAWGNEYRWTDPLVPKAFSRQNYEYGAFFSRAGGVSLPLVTVLDGSTGLSLVQSPEDPLIQMQLEVGRDGRLTFSRDSLRLGGGRTWRFSVDLVAHPADPRSALAWIVKRYPKLFDPPNPMADEVGGGGTYSGFEGKLDAPRLKRMGFTFNWKASIDFPYMGMFLAPLPKDVRWNKFAGGGGGGYTAADEGRFGTTSVEQIAAYSRLMKTEGFHVLNYFNVTEFGGNIADPPPPPSTTNPTDLWKNPNDFLYGSFPKAVLRTPDRPIWTWGGAVIMDCGQQGYQNFLLDQAQRHIREVPASSGICIDRMDWLVQFNPHADDGLSWVEGPVRHLSRSWIGLMARLGPMMHRAGKVIFVNAMVRRPDLMGQVDGIYDEHGDYGFNLNTSTWLALRKPMVCWTRDEGQLKPDPDAFVQRHLYMGAFMTVPVPGNDHTILPSKFADQLYLDYGPMFNALRGRKWVLLPFVVSTSVGKANVFQTKQGYIVPVVFGAKSASASLTLRGLPRSLRAEVLHPGDGKWSAQSTTPTSSGLRLHVPLARGCALLRLR